MHQLSKREKKIARQCIDKGLDAEFREGLQITAAIIQDWSSGKFESNREAYHALYRAISTKDRAIGRRYDDLGGSSWLITVASIFSDGYISEVDIKDFSDEAKAVIRFFNKE